MENYTDKFYGNWSSESQANFRFSTRNLVYNFKINIAFKEGLLEFINKAEFNFG